MSDAMLERAAKAVWALGPVIDKGSWTGDPPPFEVGASPTAINEEERAECFTIARAVLLAFLDTDSDELFETLEIAVAAGLKEDVDDPPLAVSRAIVSALRERIQKAPGDAST
jgi:hypothetical protein